MWKLLRSFMSHQTPPARPIIAVIGATGTGKSKLAVDLAVRFNGEIINGDAMQMYEGLPITTNQIPVEERHNIPHHLIACINPDQSPWTIKQFNRESLRIIEDIRSRGKVPILVGGTHYYVQSVLFNDSVMRNNLSRNNETQEHLNSGVLATEPVNDNALSILNASPEEIYKKLQEVDPVMADRWHPNDNRKIRRSLEIYLQTGRPASEIYKEQKKSLREAASREYAEPMLSDEDPDLQPGQAKFPLLVFWVHTDKEELRNRLDKRVYGMIDQGLLEEARRTFEYLRDMASKGVGIDRSRGVWMSIGFKELEPYIEKLSSTNCEPNPESDELKEKCIESIQTATKNYAKEQLRWITCKFWKAMRTAGVADYLYIVDSTRAEDWNTVVRQPAEDITSKFLSGSVLPHPTETSAVAKELLASMAVSNNSGLDDIPQKKVCTTCNVIIVQEDSWSAHISGQRHKRALKSLEKRKRRDEYFQKLQNEPDNKNAP